MADVPNRPKSQNKYPEQYMGNTSFDETFGVNAVEVVGLDAVNNVLTRISVDSEGKLNTNSTAPVGGATSAKQDILLTELQQKTEPSDIQNVELINALRSILQAVAIPSWFDPSTNTLRVGTTAVTVSSGTVTAVTTVGTLTNFGTNPADVMARDISIDAWANSCRSLIT